MTNTAAEQALRKLFPSSMSGNTYEPRLTQGSEFDLLFMNETDPNSVSENNIRPSAFDQITEANFTWYGQNYVIANESDQSIEVNGEGSRRQVNAIHAGDGNDKIVNKGSTGVQIRADEGNDRLTGGSGNDLLDGGADNDVLTGGGGADRFWMSEGKDVITDFNRDEGDTIFLPKLDARYTLSGVGDGESVVFQQIGEDGAIAAELTVEGASAFDVMKSVGDFERAFNATGNLNYTLDFGDRVVEVNPELFFA